MSALNAKKIAQAIPYGRQSIDSKDIAAVVKTLKGDWLTQGPAVDAFEKEICHNTGVKYAVAVANGTAALHLACLAAGIKAGDEVITSPLTFAASANCARYCGANVVFADVDAHTGLICPDAVQALISRKTKMIIPVHYAGNPCDMDKLKKIARQHHLYLLEDAAHAMGSSYRGQAIGSCSHSDMAVFSFHPLKHITTGEGGAVTTNDQELYLRLKQLRSHGITKDPLSLIDKTQGGWFYEMQDLGFNYRLSDIQSSLGISQIKKLPQFVRQRRNIAKQYDALLGSNLNVTVLKEPQGSTCAYHLYPILLTGALVKQRKEIFEQLRAAGIGVQVHYIPVYWHPYYQRLGFKKGLCPNAENFYAAQISLPMFPGLKTSDIKHIVKILLKIIDRHA